MQIDPLIGRTFDERYRIEERLGAGGMGEVYRATHLRLEKPVALKVLTSRLLESQEARARFLCEARAAGRVQHPNAVNVTDYGETQDGCVYLVMDYLEGASLRQIIANDAPLDPARAVSLMLQIAAAVAATHEAGLLHRDLKPSNIFIEQNKDAPPQVRLLDFGIAKLLQPDDHDQDLPMPFSEGGVVMGTPRYMSPEQSEGIPLTPASDVYSLGVILYEMLAGAPPFVGNAMTLVIKHATEAPRPLREIVPHIPPALEKITLHTLAKNPANRPASAALFRSQLFATAERLGLEHARADLQTALAQLKEEGTESPSGRFVIGIEKLREHRAAHRQPSAPTPEMPTAQPDTPPRAAATNETRLRRTEQTNLAPFQTPAPETPKPSAKPSKWRKGFILSVVAATVLGIGAGLMNMLRPTLALPDTNNTQPERTNGLVTAPKGPTLRGAPPAAKTSPISTQIPEPPIPLDKQARPQSVNAKRPRTANAETTQSPPPTTATHRLTPTP